MSEDRILSEEELRRSEEMLRNNVEVFGMQTNQHEANLITTIRDRDNQIAELQDKINMNFDAAKDREEAYNEQIAELNERIDTMGEVGLSNDNLKSMLKECRRRAEDLDSALSVEEEDNGKLRHQNAIMREALEWYADPEHYARAMQDISIMDEDEGQNAREALAKLHTPSREQTEDNT